MKFKRTDYLQMRRLEEEFKKGLVAAGFPDAPEVDDEGEVLDSMEVSLRNDLFGDMYGIFLAGHGWTSDEYIEMARKYNIIEADVICVENPKIVEELQRYQQEYKTHLDEKALRKADGSIDIVSSMQDIDFKKTSMSIIEKLGTTREKMILSKDGEKLILEKALEEGLGDGGEASNAAVAQFEKLERNAMN